jgi:DNA-binding transcriptional ArsR family regulator
MAKTAARLDEVAVNITRKCDEVAQVLRSVAHPVRLKILSRLAGEEVSVNALTEACGTSQSAMSQFLKRMKAEGLVGSRREGQFIYYRIADPKMHKLMRALSDIYC